MRHHQIAKTQKKCHRKQNAISLQSLHHLQPLVNSNQLNIIMKSRPHQKDENVSDGRFCSAKTANFRSCLWRLLKAVANIFYPTDRRA